MECCICLEESYDKFTTLVCKHKFHTSCIDKLHKKTCPLCRNPIKNALSSSSCDTVIVHSYVINYSIFRNISGIDELAYSN